MPEKSIIIIGAGIAGLAAGCYARKNGYRSLIFEQDKSPGGLCTSWKRGEYTITGGLAFLFGSGPGTKFHKIWEELGVIPTVRMIEYEHMIIVEGEDGKPFYFYNDVDRLERQMRELAPEDKDRIEEFVKGIRTFARYPFPIDKAPELLTLFDKMRLLLTRFPLLAAMKKGGRVTVEDFSHRLKNPFLRSAFDLTKNLIGDQMPLLFFLWALAYGHLKSCGYPEGGALKLAQAMEKHYRAMGGEVNYSQPVKKILVDDDRAAGILLEDESEHLADYVISAIDGRTAIFDLLEGKYADEKIRKQYANLPVGPTFILVGLGCSRVFPEIPHTAAGVIFRLRESVVIAGQKVAWLRPMIYNFDPTLAPAGKTLVRLCIPTDYDFWKDLSRSPERYQAEKEKIARTVIDCLDQRFPGLSSQVEMSDVATPITFERHTGNWKGSIVGWRMSMDSSTFPIRKTLPRLRNFYMAGQWVENGGGVPMVAISGRNVIQLICRSEKRPFRTE